MTCSQEAFPIYSNCHLSELGAFSIYPTVPPLRPYIRHCLVPAIVVYCDNVALAVKSNLSYLFIHTISNH